MPQAVDIEQYFDEFASASAMAEANAFPTVEAGTYRLQTLKYEGKKFDNDPRPFAHLTVAVQDSQGVKRLATVFADVTWVEGRDGYGKLDRSFKLWEGLTRALYPSASAADRAAMKVGTILAEATQYPVSGYVTERFLVPQPDGTNKWVGYKTPEEAKQYRAAGYKARNFLSSFAPLA